MSITIKANFDKDIKDFADLTKHIRRNAEFGLDKALNVTVEELKKTLKTYINEKVKATKPGGDNEDSPIISNLSKPKSDLIKYIFGQDIAKANSAKTTNIKTMDQNSNVFVIKDNRIKAYQSVGDSSNLASEESKFRDRLMSGILIDADSGKIYKPFPSDVKGSKLECSRDTGQTLDSEKKFDAYKNSDKVSRTDGTPSGRIAVWTVKQEDVRNILRNAISVDTIINKIMDGEEETAVQLLSKINKSGEFDVAIDKVKNIKLKKDLTPDLKVYQDILSLINNLKISKTISNNQSKQTKYVLFSNYGVDAEENSSFFEELRKQTYLWILSNEDFWFKSISEQVLKALQQYDSKAKFS